MPIKFTLAETMKRHGITQKALFEASGVRMNTIKDMRGGVAKALTVEKLDDLIAGINAMTGVKYGLEAVMVYEDGE